MKHAQISKTLAAIDLDGTLFGHDGVVGPENFAALERLVAHGFSIVLASGRHPINMAAIAADLPMVAGIVACQGGEVCDRRREQIFAQHFLSPAAVAQVSEAGLREGFGVVAYTTHGELTPQDGPEIDRYRRIAQVSLAPAPLAALAAQPVFKVMWIAEGARLDAFLAAGGAEHCRPADAACVRSHREVFEYGPRDVTKATGTAIFARALGLGPAQVVAFGDADNDVPLFQWAGRSVAMPHANPAVQRHATTVAPEGCAESAFARAVASVLACDPLSRST